MKRNSSGVQYLKRSLRRPIGAPSSFYRATDNSTAELNHKPSVNRRMIYVQL